MLTDGQAEDLAVVVGDDDHLGDGAVGHAPKFGRTRQLGMVFGEHLTYAFNDPQAAREGITCATQSCR
ncbi:hypothetical protein [Nonomuraea sp. NPDC003709]|uniref:hypothetical protein n=1 Tax=Nonomuraea sp. NPDC003709 TaxID=3154450 RepID=UPI0033BE1E16